MCSCIYFLLALNEAKVEVRIQFKDVTQGIFKNISRNELVLRIQPSEAVYLKLNAKTPGLYTRALPTDMDLTYKRRFSDNKIPEAYEALLLDALKGDHSNFVRHDELDHAWKVSPNLRCVRKGGDGRLTRYSPNDRAFFFFFFGPIDFHADLALDRREERSTPQALAVSVWFTRSQGH